MTIPSNTVVSTRAPAAGSQAAETQRRGRDEAAADVAGTVGVTFDLVLDAMRGLAQSARAGFEGTASAAQVFEPMADDAHGHRQAALENDYRADVSDRSAGRQSDRNGVDVRRQSNVEASTAADAARSRATEALEADRGGGVRGVEPRDADKLLEKPGQRAMQPDTAGEDRPRLGTGGESRSQAARDTQSAASVASPRAEVGTPRSAPSGGVSPVERSERPSASSPAARLARMLASGPSSGADVAKSTAVAAGSARAGGRGEAPTRAPNAKPGQASRFVSSDQASSGSSSSVEKSPFDELVRSMRLQTGTRYSSARIQMTPPELGRIQVDIRVVGDRTRIEIRTENPAAKKLLERRGAELAAALERQGIVLDAFEVLSEARDTDAPTRDADGTSVFAEQRGRGDVPSGGSSAAREVGVSATNPAPEVESGIVDAVVSETRLDIEI